MRKRCFQSPDLYEGQSPLAHQSEQTHTRARDGREEAWKERSEPPFIYGGEYQ
jgi:hypothetical protein